MSNDLIAGKTGTKTYDAEIDPHHDENQVLYAEYLSTPAAEAPLHGFFAVYRMRTPDGVHTMKKKPCNKYGHTKEPDPKTCADVGGVKLFTATAAELMDVLNQPHRRSAVIAVVRNNLTYAARKRQEEAWDDVYHTLNACCWIEEKNAPEEEQAAAWEVEAEAEKASAEAGAELEYLRTVDISLLLGRRFDAAADGIIALDCDGHHPPEDFDTDAIYREVSASGTGDHILYRVPKDLIPDTSGNKNKTTIDGREYELFYGPGNGLAISGMEAIANPAGPTLNTESPAGRIIDQLIRSGGRRANFPATRQARDEPSPKTTPIIPATELRGVLDGIITSTRKWAVLTNTTIPATPSEAFQSVCNRIAGDLGQTEAYKGLDGILTPENVRAVWEQTEIYQHHYTGESKYAPHKIDPTLQKALAYGYKRKSEAISAQSWIRRIKPETIPEPEPEPEPEEPTHPEGYCVSEDGVPEFWCDEYPHPLRYHMAHIARYAQAAMQQPNAITAWICAVFFGTVVCARQYAAELGAFGADDSALIFPRLYAIVSGKSGAGKDDINHGLTALVSAVADGGRNQKIWGLINPSSNWTSDAAVHAAIAEYPQSVAIWDECGRKIQRAQNDAIANSMLAKITEAFSRANGVLRAPHYANPKDQQLPKGIDVWHPAMSIVGLGTPRQMEAITEDMVESGQFSRFLFYTIPLRITKPVERVKFNFATHAVINEILATATFTPDLKMATRQQILKTLKWDPNAPRSACDVRNSVRELAIAAKSDADTAILNRVFEVAGILAISRTVLGTRNGLEAEYVPYDIMAECIEEAKKSMWHFHSIVVDAPVYSPREVRIADAIEQIYRKQLNSPFRADYGRDIMPRLRKMKITVGGYRGERQNVDAILLSRGIAAGKEGNIPTGRKYYYDASKDTAQAEQDEYDLTLRAVAKAAAQQNGR